MILKNTVERRLKKKARVRKKIVGSSVRPRFAVFRSTRHIYAQIIDDSQGKTPVSASSLSKTLKDEVKAAATENDVCKLVGKVAAKLALEKKITQVVFDRSGFLYHGRVKAVADGAREAGLKF
jgi:large subunit ribosomal protein L18